MVWPVSGSSPIVRYFDLFVRMLHVLWPTLAVHFRLRSSERVISLRIRDIGCRHLHFFFPVDSFVFHFNDSIRIDDGFLNENKKFEPKQTLAFHLLTLFDSIQLPLHHRQSNIVCPTSMPDYCCSITFSNSLLFFYLHDLPPLCPFLSLFFSFNASECFIKSGGSFRPTRPALSWPHHFESGIDNVYLRRSLEQLTLTRLVRFVCSRFAGSDAFGNRPENTRSLVIAPPKTNKEQT